MSITSRRRYALSFRTLCRKQLYITAIKTRFRLRSFGKNLTVHHVLVAVLDSRVLPEVHSVSGGQILQIQVLSTSNQANAEVGKVRLDGDLDL